MKIASYNVNSIKSRLGLVIQWLQRRSCDIDVLCLQEIKTLDDAFPYRDFEAMGYNCAVSGQKAYNGVAICSKALPEGTIKDFGIKELDEQKRLIGVNISGIYIYSVYAPHGDLRGLDKYYFKQRWYDALRGYLVEQAGQRKIVLAGDFNVALSDMDVYDPVLLKDVIGTMQEERSALNSILNIGFTDTFRYVHREARQFSWWDYTGGAVWKNEGMRIDYILCTSSLLSKIKDAEIDLWPRRRRTPTPSDHTPVIAEFVI